MLNTTSAEFARNAQKLIDILLRYIVPGGAFVLAFSAMQPQPSSAYYAFPGTNEESQWLLLLYITVGGATIYSIHRAFLHRVIQGLAFPIAKAVSCGVYSSYNNVTEVLRQVRSNRDEWRTDNSPWLTLYEEWSAQMHFLYCFSWGIFSALGVHWLIGTNVNNPRWFCVGLLLLLPAIVGDFRALAHQLERPSTPSSN